MSSINQENATGVTETSSPQTRPSSSQAERDSDGWTIVSPPGSSVVVRQRPLPAHIREAIARNLGIGTGTPREQ